MTDGGAGLVGWVVVAGCDSGRLIAADVGLNVLIDVLLDLGVDARFHVRIDVFSDSSAAGAAVGVWQAGFQLSAGRQCGFLICAARGTGGATGGGLLSLGTAGLL